mmetsp:Transcript_35065/g.64953  ORF Transcript_35065/g.64953 Transcript_35065/m.64953 type:complete len:118 (-) Transcript_35065:757-1110(-)
MTCNEKDVKSHFTSIHVVLDITSIHFTNNRNSHSFIPSSCHQLLQPIFNIHLAATVASLAAEFLLAIALERNLTPNATFLVATTAALFVFSVTRCCSFKSLAFTAASPAVFLVFLVI